MAKSDWQQIRETLWQFRLFPMLMGALLALIGIAVFVQDGRLTSSEVRPTMYQSAQAFVRTCHYFSFVKDRSATIGTPSFDFETAQKETCPSHAPD